MKNAIAFTLGGLLLIAAPALSRAECAGLYHSFAFPDESMGGVPPNTLIWIGGQAFHQSAYTTLALLDGTGNAIATRRTVLASPPGDVLVLRPEAHLAPGDYRVVANEDYPADEPTSIVVTRFSVAGDVDHSPPEPPKVIEATVEELTVGTETVFSEHCFGVSLALTKSGLLQIVDRDRTSTLDINAIDGRVSYLSGGESPRLNSCGNDCTGGYWPPDRDSIDLRVGAFDVAGNFSGWSDETTVHRPTGCGCAAGGGGGVFGLVALVLSVLVHANRRAR